MASKRHFRRYARRAVSLRGALSRGGEPASRQARIVNLGLGGACLELDTTLPLGEAVQLSVLAPHRWDPVLVDGEVAWCLQGVGGIHRLGMRFRHQTGGAMRALVEILSSAGYD